jgi:hypothetical protein
MPEPKKMNGHSREGNPKPFFAEKELVKDPDANVRFLQEALRPKKFVSKAPCEEHLEPSGPKLDKTTAIACAIGIVAVGLGLTLGFEFAKSRSGSQSQTSIVEAVGEILTEGIRK